MDQKKKTVFKYSTLKERWHKCQIDSRNLSNTKVTNNKMRELMRQRGVIRVVGDCVPLQLAQWYPCNHPSIVFDIGHWPCLPVHPKRIRLRPKMGA
jgi:hypothetical protein